MKRSLAMLAAVVALAGCAGKGTPEQQAARGKAIAKLEKRAWNIGGFLANLAGNILVNTATNFANEQINRSNRGFAK